MTSRYVLIAALLATTLALWAAASGARAQSPQPCGPCQCTFDRVVQPHEILVNEKVHVTIDLECECPPEEQKGIDIFFVVDRTSAMFTKGYMDPTKAALTSFVNAMDFEKGSAGLITYASSDHIASNLSKDRERILYQINVMRHSQETNQRGLQVAFRKAVEKLDNDGTPGNAKIVLIVVAGADEQGENINMPTVTRSARNAGVEVVFLMFPDALYAHYVAAASACHGPPCPNWSGSGYRWAWEVNETTIGTMLGNTLPSLLLQAPALQKYQIYEAMNSGSAYDAASANPPHTNRPTTPDIYWEWTKPNLPNAGVHIEYDAELVYADYTYPVTDISEATVELTDGASCLFQLPNPPITVRSAMTPTPTDVVTETPTPSATSTESATPTATTVGATETPTPDDAYRVYLTIALMNWEL